MAVAGGHSAAGAATSKAKVASAGGCRQVNETVKEIRERRGLWFFFSFSWRGCLEFFPLNFTFQLSLHIVNYKIHQRATCVLAAELTLLHDAAKPLNNCPRDNL